MLAELGRIEVDLDDPELTRVLARIHVGPLDLGGCRAPRSRDVRGDPAEDLIALTSLVHRLPPVTRDRRLRRSKVLTLAP
jgi:PIN domain nuclease of toxin-antitoxin system